MATDRRKFLQSLACLPLLALLPPALRAQIVSREPPHSPYGADSTAEEVTAGLDLSGLTCAITGANSGLGYETMRVLALRGAHVIGIARNEEKAAAACAGIVGKATPEYLDLADFDSVVACGERIRASGVVLDGLICNAGIMALPDLERVNGVERQFAVNHLGHFILINQLAAPVLRAPQGRFVILSSRAHRQAPAQGILFDDLAFQRTAYDPWSAYGHSKLANALCARALARRLNGTPATANSVHPGIINTNLVRNLPWYQQLAVDLFGWTFMKTVEEGAATQTYVATNPALVGVNGYYFADCNPAPGGTPAMQDDAMAERLWAVSAELTAQWLPEPSPFGPATG